MKDLRRSVAVKRAAAILGLAVYGLGLGWMAGGKRCGECGRIVAAAG